MRILASILALLTLASAMFIGGIVVRDDLKVAKAFERVAKVDKAYATQAAATAGRGVEASDTPQIPSPARFRAAAFAMGAALLLSFAAFVTLFAYRRYGLHAAGAASALAVISYLLVPKLPGGGHELTPDGKTLVTLCLLAFATGCSLLLQRLRRRSETPPRAHESHPSLA